MHQFDWKQNGCVVTFFGDVGIDEINRANGTLHCDQRLERNAFQIWDLSNVAQLNVSASEARIPAAIDQAASSYMTGMKIAIVSDNNLYQAVLDAYTNDIAAYVPDWQCQIFSTLEQALNWVESTSQK